VQDSLYVDIETYSATNLKVSGVYRYTEDPDFQILMAGWALNDDPVQVVESWSDIDRIPGLWDPEVRKVAHNATFERICFSAFDSDGCYLPGRYLDPADWHDTAVMAAERGYPRSLADCARALGVEQKDSAGAALIRFFCVPDRNGKRRLPEDHPEKWEQFKEYCRQDVVVLRDIDKALGSEFPTAAERAVYLADQRINDRGLLLDVPMVHAAVEAANDSLWENELRLTALTGLKKPNGPGLGPWLRESGLKVPNLQAETVEKLLERDDLTATQRRVLSLRQDLALASVKKFHAAAASVSADGRLRGRFQFHGAHTGRWAGRGAQPQNLPSAVLSPSAEDAEVLAYMAANGADKETLELVKSEAVDRAVAAAVADLLMGESVDTHTLKALVRSMFLIDGTVVDYSSIEARVLAWLAGEEWALAAFRKGRDIYVETAKRMSTPGNELTRKQGKVAVLALGYNGGINSLRNMGGEGTDQELKALVYQWRDANANIVQFWRTMGHAFRLGGQIGEYVRIEKDGSDRHMHLPSGRVISYHQCRFKSEQTDWGQRWDMSFASSTSPGRRDRTYGGRLTENVTQAVARDILAEALVRLEQNGFQVVGHVHDEILIEGSRDIDTITKIMTVVPDWATDLPVDGEGFTSYRYKKD
jgi:DNA polymerase